MAILDLSHYQFTNPEIEEAKKKQIMQSANTPVQTDPVSNVKLSLPDDNNNANNKWKDLGAKLKPLQNEIGGTLAAASNAYNNHSTTAQTNNEADGRTFNTVVDFGKAGSGIGSAVGGPIGGLVGAAVGGLGGLLMGSLNKTRDKKRRLDSEYRTYESGLYSDIMQRSITAEDYNNQTEIENMAKLKKAQMGLLDFNY